MLNSLPGQNKAKGAEHVKPWHGG